MLAIEILGTRILGPFYGATLFLWSALITVTLVSLSVGYFVGGRLAYRRGSLKLLGILTGSAGLWMLLVPLIKRPILLWLEPHGLRLAVLMGATLLFAPPLTLLGMISPVAIRVKAARLRDVGRSAGDLFAISTLGGVSSALLTGFFLVPSVGINRLTLLVGLLLLAAAAVAFVVDRKSRGRIVPAIPVILVWVFAAIVATDDSPSRTGGVQEVVQSAYGEIRVLDLPDGSRHMLIDGGVHSSVLIGTWRSLQPYIWVTDIGKLLFRETGSMLLIGLGAGSTADSYLRDGWRVRAVEIDPIVTRLARQYFGLSLADERIVHDDGRKFLRATEESYQLIVLDAFSSNSIPFHLFTSESFGLVKSRLEQGGVFAMNVESVGWHSRIVASVMATLQEHFAHVQAVPVNESPQGLTNLIIFASERPLNLQRAIDDVSAEGQHRQAAWNRRFSPEAGEALVLTDDRSPIDVWSETINVVSRLDLHAGFEKAGLRGANW